MGEMGMESLAGAAHASQPTYVTNACTSLTLAHPDCSPEYGHGCRHEPVHNVCPQLGRRAIQELILEQDLQRMSLSLLEISSLPHDSRVRLCPDVLHCYPVALRFVLLLYTCSPLVAAPLVRCRNSKEDKHAYWNVYTAGRHYTWRTVYDGAMRSRQAGKLVMKSTQDSKGRRMNLQKQYVHQLCYGGGLRLGHAHAWGANSGISVQAACSHSAAPECLPPRLVCWLDQRAIQ
jgi:hypothetical protein